MTPHQIGEILLFGGLIPAVITWLIFGLARRTSPRPGDLRDRLAGALALSAGFLAGFHALALGPWKPNSPQTWAPYVTLIAGLGHVTSPTLHAAWRRARRIPRFVPVLGIVGVGLAAAWLLAPSPPDVASQARWRTGVGGATLALWMALERSTRSQPGPLLPGLWMIIALSGAFVIQSTGLSNLPNQAGLLATLTGATAVVCWRIPHVFSALGMTPAFAVLLVSMLAIGHFHNHFSETPAASFGLLFLAPWGSLLGAMNRVQCLPEPWRSATRSAAVIAPCALAVALAM